MTGILTMLPRPIASDEVSISQDACHSEFGWDGPRVLTPPSRGLPQEWLPRRRRL
jgi:hypothetical protein